MVIQSHHVCQVATQIYVAEWRGWASSEYYDGDSSSSTTYHSTVHGISYVMFATKILNDPHDSEQVSFKR